MNFQLETERLHIRRFQDSDLESFFAYRNDPEVARYQGWDGPYPREKALAFCVTTQAKYSIPEKWCVRGRTPPHTPFLGSLLGRQAGLLQMRDELCW